MICASCKKETLICYFDKCERCYALETFATHPPTEEDIENANAKICKCHTEGYPFPWKKGTVFRRCGRCDFIKKYFKRWKFYL